MKAQTLKNIEVPWQVSSSASDLALNFSEEGQKACIEVIANFGQHSVLMEQVIRVNFSGVGWVKISPPFSDRSSLDVTTYDHSYINGIKNEDEAISDWIRRFNKEWEETTVCPNSQFYLVRNSLFCDDVNAKKWSGEHYILCGERSRVDIIATSFEWDIVNTGSVA